MSLYSDIVIADKPIHYWKLDETSGTVAADSGSSPSDGTIESGVVMGEVSLYPLSDAAPSMVFDGVSRVLIADGETLLGDVDELTLELWLQADDSAQSAPRIIFETGGVAHGVVIYLYQGELYAGIVEGESIYYVQRPITTGEPHHVAFASHNEGNSRRAFLYIDGELVVEDTFAVAADANWGVNSGAIGGHQSTRTHVGTSGLLHFIGKIQDVAIYDRVLPTSRIREHYDAALGRLPHSYYRLYRATTPDFAQAILLKEDKSKIIRDDGRKPGQTYYYWISAVDAVTRRESVPVGPIEVRSLSPEEALYQAITANSLPPMPYVTYFRREIIDLINKTCQYRMQVDGHIPATWHVIFVDRNKSIDRVLHKESRLYYHSSSVQSVTVPFVEGKVGIPLLVLASAFGQVTSPAGLELSNAFVPAPPPPDVVEEGTGTVRQMKPVLPAGASQFARYNRRSIYGTTELVFVSLTQTPDVGLNFSFGDGGDSDTGVYYNIISNVNADLDTATYYIIRQIRLDFTLYWDIMPFHYRIYGLYGSDRVLIGEVSEDQAPTGSSIWLSLQVPPEYNMLAPDRIEIEYYTGTPDNYAGWGQTNWYNKNNLLVASGFQLQNVAYSVSGDQVTVSWTVFNPTTDARARCYAYLDYSADQQSWSTTGSVLKAYENGNATWTLPSGTWYVRLKVRSAHSGIWYPDWGASEYEYYDVYGPITIP